MIEKRYMKYKNLHEYLFLIFYGITALYSNIFKLMYHCLGSSWMNE